MLKYGVKYKIKNTNYLGVFIKKEKNFSIFLNVNEDNNILGVDFFQREIKAKEIGIYCNQIDSKYLNTSFENLAKNKEIVSIELCKSGYCDVLGYIIGVKKDFILVHCIHEHFCLDDGIAEIKIDTISNLSYGFERENKVSKFFYEEPKREEDVCIQEIYHKNPNVFILGIQKNFDTNFVKIKTLDILGENDSITFLKKDSIFMIKSDTLYIKPYTKSNLKMKECFEEFDSFSSIWEILDYCRLKEKKIKLYFNDIEKVGKIFTLFPEKSIVMLNGKKFNINDIEYISIEKEV